MQERIRRREAAARREEAANLQALTAALTDEVTAKTLQAAGDWARIKRNKNKDLREREKKKREGEEELLWKE